jgi:spore germination cell wall hydrolase CwlJ-like protein
MRIRQFMFVLGLSTMTLPAAAKQYAVALSTTTALDDLRRLSASTIIPAIQHQPAVQHDQILCLALAMYHEARGETEAERLAVAQVIYNRAVRTDATVCATVWAENGTQFQWVKSSSTIVPREAAIWRAVQESAVRFARHRPADSTHGATNFYNPALCSPNWATHPRYF